MEKSEPELVDGYNEIVVLDTHDSCSFELTAVVPGQHVQGLCNSRTKILTWRWETVVKFYLDEKLQAPDRCWVIEESVSSKSIAPSRMIDHAPLLDSYISKSVFKAQTRLLSFVIF